MDKSKLKIIGAVVAAIVTVAGALGYGPIAAELKASICTPTAD